MSFYGVAHDRLPRVVADSDAAVRATVSTSFMLAGADRPIGVWWGVISVRRQIQGFSRWIYSDLAPEAGWYLKKQRPLRK